MEIVGRGFIAGNLADVTGRHPAATVLAAGVSSTSVQEAGEFARETDLVHDVARRCHREGRLLVFLSSASHALYGTTTVPAREDSTVRPPSPYGRHKRALECAIAESGTRWLMLRVSHVVGRGQRSHQLLPSLTSQIRGGSVRVYQGVYRDLVDVRDLVGVVDGLLAQGIEGEVVNVASGHPHPAEAIVRGIEQRMAAAPRHDMVTATPSRTLVSIEKLCTLLPRMRSVTAPDYLDQILDRYVTFY
jgi:NDP-hexose 4-ketoreductase